MSSHPFLKSGLLCALSIVLFSSAARAEVLTENLSLNVPGMVGYRSSPPGTFTIPNFNTAFGTLEKIELTLKINPRKTVTIFSTANPSQNFVNVLLVQPGSSTEGSSVTPFEGSSAGELAGLFQKGNVSVRSMGLAGYILYYDGKPHASTAVQVNYTFNDVASGGGGTGAVPEPSGKALSALAAGAMMLLLIGRSVRRRV